MEEDLLMPLSNETVEIAKYLQTLPQLKSNIECQAAINNVLACGEKGIKCDYRDSMLIAKLADSFCKMDEDGRWSPIS